jgi:hypothetical protein
MNDSDTPREILRDAVGILFAGKIRFEVVERWTKPLPFSWFRYGEYLLAGNHFELIFGNRPQHLLPISFALWRSIQRFRREYRRNWMSISGMVEGLP